MKNMIAGIVKGLFTEGVLKQIFLVVGDFLVESSKNKLDDKIWSTVKKKLV